MWETGYKLLHVPSRFTYERYIHIDQFTQVQELLNHFHEFLFWHNPVMFYTMIDTTFSISTNASSFGYIWIHSPYSIDFTDAPDIREILGLDGRTVILPASFYGSNVIDITRNRQVNQVYSSLVRSSDLKIANQNNNLSTTMIFDDPTTNYCRSVEDKCIPMITRSDRLMLLKGFERFQTSYLSSEWYEE